MWMEWKGNDGEEGEDGKWTYESTTVKFSNHRVFPKSCVFGHHDESVYRLIIDNFVCHLRDVELRELGGIHLWLVWTFEVGYRKNSLVEQELTQ